MKSLSIPCALLRIGIEYELESYKDHVTNVEELMRSEIKKFDEHHKNITQSMEKYEAAEYTDFISNSYWELADKHPEIQRKSELISIYTILENGLNQICHNYERSLETSVKLLDLSGNGIIDKSKKYLEKVAGVSFPVQSSEWQEIKKIQKIRNAYVHNNGLVKSSNTDIINYVNSSQLIHFKTDTKLAIKSGFTIHCLNLFQKFFSLLFTEIEKCTPTFRSSSNEPIQIGE